MSDTTENLENPNILPLGANDPSLCFVTNPLCGGEQGTDLVQHLPFYLSIPQRKLVVTGKEGGSDLKTRTPRGLTVIELKSTTPLARLREGSYRRQGTRFLTGIPNVQVAWQIPVKGETDKKAPTLTQLKPKLLQAFTGHAGSAPPSELTLNAIVDLRGLIPEQFSCELYTQTSHLTDRFRLHQYTDLLSQEVWVDKTGAVSFFSSSYHSRLKAQWGETRKVLVVENLGNEEPLVVGFQTLTWNQATQVFCVFPFRMTLSLFHTRTGQFYTREFISLGVNRALKSLTQDKIRQFVYDMAVAIKADKTAFLKQAPPDRDKLFATEATPMGRFWPKLAEIMPGDNIVVDKAAEARQRKRFIPSSTLSDIMINNETREIPAAQQLTQKKEQLDRNERDLLSSQRSVRTLTHQIKTLVEEIEYYQEQLEDPNVNRLSTENAIQIRQSSMENKRSSKSHFQIKVESYTQAKKKLQKGVTKLEERLTETRSAILANFKSLDWAERLYESNVIVNDVVMSRPNGSVSLRARPEAAKDPNMTIREIIFTNPRPILMSVVTGERVQEYRVAGPFQVRLSSGNLELRPATSDAIFGIMGSNESAMSIKLHPHMGGFSIQKADGLNQCLRSWYGVCLGEGGSAVFEAFDRVDIEGAINVGMSWLRTCNANDIWGKSYKKFPRPQEVFLRGREVEEKEFKAEQAKYSGKETLIKRVGNRYYYWRIEWGHKQIAWDWGVSKTLSLPTFKARSVATIRTMTTLQNVVVKKIAAKKAVGYETLESQESQEERASL